MKSLLLVLSLASFSAFANDAAEYTDLLSRSTLTISQATQAAESSLSGTAVSAELENWKGTVIYEVDVLAGNKVYDVFVDANTGAILLSREDR